METVLRVVSPEEVLRRQETNTDAILTYNGNVNKDISITAQTGGIVSNYYKRNYIYIGELVIDRLYNAGMQYQAKTQLLQPLRE